MVNLSLCKSEKERSTQNTAPTDDRKNICMPGTCVDKTTINADGSITDGRDAKCDVCGTFVSCVAVGETCAESASDRDGKCDICGTQIKCIDGDPTWGHVDADPKDTRCDYCGGEVACTSHVDIKKYENGVLVDGKDSICDICNKHNYCEVYGRDCVDSNDTKFGVRNCDLCGKELTCQELESTAKCVDGFDNTNSSIQRPDGKCDKCGQEHECAYYPNPCRDENADGKCDVCELQKTCPDFGRLCKDEDSDNTCDVCGKTEESAS